MSIIGSNVLAGASGSGVEAYEIEQSLRFDGGASLSRSGTIKGASTFSVWIKRGKLNDTFGVLGLREGSTSNYKQLFFEGSSYDSLGFDNSSGGNAYSNNKFRDPSAWFHVVVVSNTTGTGSKMYINGEEVSYRIQTTTTSSDTTGTIYIGALNGGGSQLNGYLAELHIVDSALEPTDFAEEDANGVWRPIEFTGSYGSNGVYLKFDPDATNGIGHDHSGNGNNFTATGFTTSGTGTDVMSDTPTTNWATLNPNDLGASSFAEGNLVATANSSGNKNAGMPLCTIRPSSGKYYAEMTVVTTGEISISAGFFSPSDGDYRQRTSYYRAGGIYVDQSGQVATGASYSSGDTVGIALDLDNQEVRYVGPSGQNYGPYDISGINQDIEYASIAFHQGSGSGSCRGTMNYGQRDFEHTPPTGFEALNTANLPAPDIKDGSDYFNTVLWTGNATARDITTGHNSNFTWIKHRSSAENHNLYDILRGTGNRVESNSTDKEINYTDRLTAFNSDGFSLGTGYNNTNTTTYVGWSWAGGGSGSSNTNGSITSTVSVSATSGFSIVTYTGTDAAATVGHGLGVAPSLIITRNRDSNSVNWRVQHASLGPTKYLSLNLTAAAGTASSVWNDTAPTSTVFSVANDGGSNGSSQDMVAYCFAEVESYSRIGSYVGNGSSDGPFVFTGHKVAWLLIKRYDSGSTNDWYVFDAVRNTYNAVNSGLFPSSNLQEFTQTSYDIDFASNGFKFRNSNAGLNASGGTYIFMSLAENPFGGDGVSPATAR